MPFSIEFPLRLPRGAERVPPHLLRNNVYRWLGGTHGQSAHSGENAPRPFRVSTLATYDGGASFRIALLDDALFDPLVDGLRREPFVLDRERRIEIADVPDPIGQTYRDMLAHASTAPRLTLEFLTPTSFHVNGLAYVLPDPMRVFESYWKAWNAFAPANARFNADWLGWAADNIAISRMRLGTGVLRFAEHDQIGFVGLVQFAAQDRADEAALGVFNTLADFAFYCGTGHKTSQGMGQTRRVEPGDEAAAWRAAGGRR